MEAVLATRRISTLALAGLLAALIGTAWLASPLMAEENEVSPARMVFTSVVHDAGNVERGALITHSFTFRNAGGSDLVILSTKAG